jgi:hypothetical protein
MIPSTRFRPSSAALVYTFRFMFANENLIDSLRYLTEKKIKRWMAVPGSNARNATLLDAASLI